MKGKLLAGILIYFFLVTIGCSTTTNYRPVVYPENVTMSQYEKDLAECKAISQQKSPVGEGAKGTAIGAATGALLGLGIGSLTGDAGKGAAIGAGSGALAGAAGGGAKGLSEQKKIIRNCMTQKGYKILD